MPILQPYFEPNHFYGHLLHAQYFIILPDICLDTANIEMWMSIVLLEQFRHLQLAKISSTWLQLHYNVLVSSEVKELQKDFICYDAIPPNSSELIEDFMNNDANPDSYIWTNPEPSIQYAATSSSSMQQNYPLKSDDNSTTIIFFRR